jgi:formamidopyrimidine-DNA glycosylase
MLRAMPELPEVETVARELRPRLAGRRVRGAEVLWRRTLANVAPRAFARGIAGARIESVGRRGKLVVIELARRGADAGLLAAHLRMTGRFAVEPRGFDAGPHLRVRIDLDRGESLFFTDARKFGRMWLARDLSEVAGALGPEPLSAEFTGEWLARGLRARRRMLKPLLLDQTFVAGIGNIYADESLFRARLHPLARSDRVTRAEAERLAAAIRETLRDAIARDGSSFDAFYRTPNGRPGSYQDEFRVYGREGEPCAACGAPVRRIVVAQRGTHVCPRCQRPPRRGVPRSR